MYAHGPGVSGHRQRTVPEYLHRIPAPLPDAPDKEVKLDLLFVLSDMHRGRNGSTRDAGNVEASFGLGSARRACIPRLTALGYDQRDHHIATHLVSAPLAVIIERILLLPVAAHILESVPNGE